MKCHKCRWYVSNYTMEDWCGYWGSSKKVHYNDEECREQRYRRITEDEIRRLRKQIDLIQSVLASSMSTFCKCDIDHAEPCVVCRMKHFYEILLKDQLNVLEKDVN